MKNHFHVSAGVLINVVISIILMFSSFIFSNGFLVYNSYLLYGIQFIAMILFLLTKVTYVKDLFLPSFFTLIYYSVNLFLGSYLSPRGYGFVTWFINDLRLIENYNLIVPYFLATNLALFLISYYSLNKLNIKYASYYPVIITGLKLDILLDIISLFFAVALFFVISYFKIYSLFSFQLIIIIIYCSYISFHRKWYRYMAYLIFLFAMVLFNFENKREIIIVLFFFLFIEAFFSQWALRLTLRRLIIYSAGVILFFGLILTSSILRGYGNFKVKTVSGAISHIPEYIKSDIFIDGFAENLELNYNYSTAVTSMDMILKGEIKYQYGLTLIKVLFLPVPRDLFPYKPMSSMQIYTRAFKYDYWEGGGSLPIIFPCDMFMNFSFFGLLPFAFIFYILDSFFIKFHLITIRNIRYYSYPFLFITILVFARGSGLELYILNYLLAIPVIIIHILIRQNVQVAIKKNITDALTKDGT